MGIEASTVVDLINVTGHGTLEIRFLKRLHDPATGQFIEGWHRTTVDPGGDANQQIASVNAHLQKIGLPAIANGDAALIRSAQSFKPGGKAFERNRDEPVSTVKDDSSFADRAATAFPDTRLDAPRAR